MLSSIVLVDLIYISIISPLLISHLENQRGKFVHGLLHDTLRRHECLGHEGVHHTVEIVVHVGQSRVDTTKRGSDDAVDHNVFLVGHDRVDALALHGHHVHDFLDTIHRHDTITHGHGISTTYGHGTFALTSR